MEVQLILDDALIEGMLNKIGSGSVIDLTRNALTMFRWAIEETVVGRVILSTNDDGQDVRILDIPSLTNIRGT